VRLALVSLISHYRAQAIDSPHEFIGVPRQPSPTMGACILRRRNLRQLRPLACHQLARNSPNKETFHLDTRPAFRESDRALRPILDIADIGCNPEKPVSKPNRKPPRLAKNGPARGCSGKRRVGIRVSEESVQRRTDRSLRPPIARKACDCPHRQPTRHRGQKASGFQCSPFSILDRISRSRLLIAFPCRTQVEKYP
jgi:hypothetical protein